MLRLHAVRTHLVVWHSFRTENKMRHFESKKSTIFCGGTHGLVTVLFHAILSGPTYRNLFEY